MDCRLWEPRNNSSHGDTVAHRDNYADRCPHTFSHPDSNPDIDSR